MNLENTDTVTAFLLYSNTEKGGLHTGYTALENWGLRGWLARRLMELQRQMDRTAGALEGAARLKYLHWKHQRVEYEIAELKRLFRSHGHEMGKFAVLEEFKYGFRVRLVEFHRIVKFRHGLKRSVCEHVEKGQECGELILNWRSAPGNVPVVIEYTDSILSEALGRPTDPTREVPSGPTAG